MGEVRVDSESKSQSISGEMGKRAQQLPSLTRMRPALSPVPVPGAVVLS